MHIKRYSTILKRVEAVRFDKSTECMELLIKWGDGDVFKFNDGSCTVNTPDGYLICFEGSYIVKASDKELFILSEKDFVDTFIEC
jgi:hypothetical protein